MSRKRGTVSGRLSNCFWRTTLGLRVSNVHQSLHDHALTWVTGFLHATCDPMCVVCVQDSGPACCFLRANVGQSTYWHLISMSECVFISAVNKSPPLPLMESPVWGECPGARAALNGPWDWQQRPGSRRAPGFTAVYISHPKDGPMEREETVREWWEGGTGIHCCRFPSPEPNPLMQCSKSIKEGESKRGQRDERLKTAFKSEKRLDGQTWSGKRNCRDLDPLWWNDMREEQTTSHVNYPTGCS